MGSRAEAALDGESVLHSFSAIGRVGNCCSQTHREAVSAADGALLGHKLGKGKPLSAALGAGGGVLLGESLQAGGKSSAQKFYAAGYENGQSDSAKRQYQALTERQRIAPQSDDAAHLRLFDVPLPEREQNSVKRRGKSR